MGVGPKRPQPSDSKERAKFNAFWRTVEAAFKHLAVLAKENGNTWNLTEVRVLRDHIQAVTVQYSEEGGAPPAATEPPPFAGLRAINTQQAHSTPRSNPTPTGTKRSRKEDTSASESSSSDRADEGPKPPPPAQRLTFCAPPSTTDGGKGQQFQVIDLLNADEPFSRADDQAILSALNGLDPSRSETAAEYRRRLSELAVQLQRPEREVSQRHRTLARNPSSTGASTATGTNAPSVSSSITPQKPCGAPVKTSNNKGNTRAAAAREGTADSDSDYEPVQKKAKKK